MNIKQEIRKLTKKKRKKKPLSDKAKKRLAIKSKRNHKKRYYEYLKSKEWAEIRIDLFNNRGKKCEKCESITNLQIHHLHYRNIFKEEPEDLVILCKNCHKLEHSTI